MSTEQSNYYVDSSTLSNDVTSSMTYTDSSTTGWTSIGSGIDYNTIGYDKTEFGGEVLFKGDIYLEGDVYQRKEKMESKKSDVNDVEIEVVDNGFMAKIGPKTFVFSDLGQLDDWMKNNFSTPEEAKKTIREAKGVSKQQQDLLDAFEKIDLNIPNMPQIPHPNPTSFPWAQPTFGGTGTVTYPTYGDNTYTSSTNVEKKNVSGNTTFSDMYIKIFGDKRKKEKK